MVCKFCEKECSCHISPPCGFCTTHVSCDLCGQLVCEDKAIEFQDNTDGSAILTCPDCDEAYADLGERR